MLPALKMTIRSLLSLRPLELSERPWCPKRYPVLAGRKTEGRQHEEEKQERVEQRYMYEEQGEKKVNISPRGDLNSRPLVYKTSALTPELLRPCTPHGSEITHVSLEFGNEMLDEGIVKVFTA